MNDNLNQNLIIMSNKETKQKATNSDTNPLVSCKAVDEMPVFIEHDNKRWRFIAFPEEDGGWNCGYISEDLKTTFINREMLIGYETLEDAARACKKAIKRCGLWPYN